MTNTRTDSPLSPTEIIVLSRLSCSKPPSENVIAKSLSELAPPKIGSALETVKSTLSGLRGRKLVHKKPRTMTDAGHRALQAAFGLNRTPLWSDIRVSHLLALALKLPVGTEKTNQALDSAETVARTVLGVMPAPPRDDKTANKLLAELFHLSSTGLTLPQLRDEIANRVIREALGISGQITIAHMRAQVLAKQDGKTTEVAGSKSELLRQASAKLNETCDDKNSLRRVIVRNWAYGIQLARTVETPRAPAQGTLVLLNGNGTTPPDDAHRQGPSLLQTVRETLPRIGSDGRFGPEKVFISALWHRLERDRAVDLSLDRFKTWLVDANREQQIDLVRADLVGAMDPKLVAESEIEDLGATFHFVVDRQAGNRRPHA